jgi:hypothetical protein
LSSKAFILYDKLRSDTLKLNVETGRYQNVARENRICLSYNMNALEDKYHFVLVCPAHRYIITTLLFMAKKIHKRWYGWMNERFIA